MTTRQQPSLTHELDCGVAEGDVVAVRPAASANDPLTERTRVTWTAGDFGRIARTYTASAEAFVAGLGLQKNTRVLDVACGTGNLAIPAARGGAHVVGIDIAANLVEQARTAAASEGLDATFDEGNAEELPYADGSFDVVMTMFGAMFAARPDRVASELLRVCRPGGRVAMANWTPEGFVGEMLRVVAAHVPPAPGVPGVLLWGMESVVRERLSTAAQVQVTRRTAYLEMPFGPAGAVDYFLTWYGPTVRAYASLDVRGRDSMRSQLESLFSRHNAGTDGSTRVPAEYLEVVATR